MLTHITLGVLLLFSVPAIYGILQPLSQHYTGISTLMQVPIYHQDKLKSHDPKNHLRKQQDRLRSQKETKQDTHS